MRFMWTLSDEVHRKIGGFPVTSHENRGSLPASDRTNSGGDIQPLSPAVATAAEPFGVVASTAGWPDTEPRHPPGPRSVRPVLTPHAASGTTPESRSLADRSHADVVNQRGGHARSIPVQRFHELHRPEDQDSLGAARYRIRMRAPNSRSTPGAFVACGNHADQRGTGPGHGVGDGDQIAGMGMGSGKVAEKWAGTGGWGWRGGFVLALAPRIPTPTRPLYASTTTS